MLKAMIFDSFYDKHRGAVAYIRIFEGQIKAGDTVHFLATNTRAVVLEIGVFKPAMTVCDLLTSGEVGYLITGLKELDKVTVGDTVSSTSDPSNALAGYKQVEPKVFASIFTIAQEDYPKLRDSITKLKMNDAALYYEPENIPALGFGFRCGFLGLLHLDIVKERLEREFDMDILITTPSVEYKVITRNNVSVIDSSEPVLSPFEQLKKQLIANVTIDDLANLI